MQQLSAILWTFALEGVAAAALARRLGSQRAPGHAVLAAVVGSLVTHPFVWMLNEAWAKPGGGWALKIAVLEIGAALIETVAYRLLARLPWPRALAMSVIANAFSFGVGLLLFAAGAL